MSAETIFPILDDHAPELMLEARSLGVVTGAELESGEVALIAVSGASVLTRALTVRGRPVAYVKVADRDRARSKPSRTLRIVGSADWPAAAQLRSLERERAVLDALRTTRLAPRVIAATATSLWLAATPGTSLAKLSAHRLPPLTDLMEMARGFGAALARLHSTSVTTGTPVCPCPASGGDLADRWRPTTWIHGGLAPESILVDPQEPIDVRLVGYGCAGLGDPGWDLALALECFVALDLPRALDRARLEEDFWLGYRRAGGPGRLEPSYRAWAARARRLPGSPLRD